MAEKAHVDRGDDPTQGRYVDFYKFLQMGRIVRVDNEKNVVDIQFGTNVIKSTNVPISSPFFTGRAFIGGMPEVGSYVVCGYLKLTNKVGMPIILAYLDMEYVNSIKYIYNIGKSDGLLKQISTIHEKIGYGIERQKRKKLYPGDAGMESTQGSEVMVDDNVLLSDSKLNEILLSASDRTIYSNSINNHIYTNAARILNGMVVRPNASSISPVIMDNGQEYFVRTDSGLSIDENGRAFTEVRTEVREYAEAVLDVIESFNEIDFADNTAEGQLLLSHIIGTVVGNNRAVPEQYGKVLRPQIFASESKQILPADLICEPEFFNSLASAFQLKFKSGTKFDIDKEGHAFINLAASSVRHPLGGGRSLEFGSAGAIRAVIGKTNVGEKSLDLTTKGRMIFNIGYDNESMKSLEINTERAMSVNVNGVDTEGFAKKETFAGHAYEKVKGNKTIDVDGTLNVIVKGLIQEDVLGAKNENYVNDKMTNYGGDYQEIITKQRQSKYGNGHVTDIALSGSELNITEGDKTETLLLGNKDVKLTAGNSKETLLLGDRETSLVAGDIKRDILTGNEETSITLGDNKLNVTTGNIEQSVKLGDSKEDIATGNKTITVKVGDFEVSVTTGSVKVQTTVGTVDIKSATQKVTINGTMKVDIISATKVEVKAPMVDIGQTPVRGGIVTGLPMPSHYDFVTGSPLIGSVTCKSAI